MSSLDVETIAKYLKSATSFVSIFGNLGNGDIKAKRGVVRKQFAYLAQVVHPDHAPDCPAMAEKTFEALQALYKAAEQALIDGTYEKDFPAGIAPGSKAIENFFELTSKTNTYRCSNTPFKTGDFAVFYRAQLNGRDVLVKIARDPTTNPLLETEGSRLKQFRTNMAIKGIHPFLPELLDSFVIPGPGKRQFRCNVMTYVPGLVSLTDIKAAFPAGLVPQHAAWIVRRVMAQPLAAQMTGLVHGSITPDHVLVDPIKHEPMHIGWLHATKDTRLTMIVDRWKDFYPPEVMGKKVPTHQTDLYMAAKTAIWLFGSGNRLPDTIPEPIRRILLGCVASDLKRRPSDGMAVLTDLTTAIRTAWGRSYQPLMMPI